MGIHVTRKSPVVDQDDEPYAICAVSTDITDRKVRERELELTMELLSSTERMGDVGSWDLDIKAETATWTEGTRRIFGVDETFDPEVESVLEFFPAANREALVATIERSVETGEPFEDEFEIRRQDGSRRHLAIRGEQRVPAEGDPAIRGYVQDVTERERRERELVAARERLDTVVSNVPVVLFALDAEGTFTLSEGKGLQSLGLEPGEVIGESVFDIYGWHDNILAAAKRALDGDLVSEVYTVGDIAFEATFQPVFDDAGDLERVIGVAVDISDLEVPGGD